MIFMRFMIVSKCAAQLKIVVKIFCFCKVANAYQLVKTCHADYHQCGATTYFNSKRGVFNFPLILITKLAHSRCH